MITQNEKGEYALYDKGKLLRFAPVKLIDGHKVIDSMYDKIMAIKEAAHHDGIILSLASGFRSWDEQMNLRIKNVIDKSKANDVDYLTKATSDKFNPRTAEPGWSNHQDGQAYDFTVTGHSEVYRWLIKHAFSFGFIRTVKSERWHWEHRPGSGMFDVVKKDDPSWDGLIDNQAEVAHAPRNIPQSGVVLSDKLNIRSGAGAAYAPIANPLTKGKALTIQDETNGWYKVTTQIEGWVKKDYVKT